MQLESCRRLLGALLFVLAGCSAAIASAGTVKGNVTDSEGAAINGAHLLFHLDSSGKHKSAPSPDAVRDTDTMGRYAIQLEPGFYDVCVMANAFAPKCSKILVPEAGDVQHDVHLKVDPLVMKHLGDTF